MKNVANKRGYKIYMYIIKIFHSFIVMGVFYSNLA